MAIQGLYTRQVIGDISGVTQQNNTEKVQKVGKCWRKSWLQSFKKSKKISQEIV